MRGPATEVIDLQGRTVVPGFIDTHGHGHFVSPRGAGLVSGGDLICETVQKCLEEVQAGVAKGSSRGMDPIRRCSQRRLDQSDDPVGF